MRFHIRPKTFDCANCGAAMKINRKTRKAKCSYCGNVYEIPEEKKKKNTHFSQLFLITINFNNMMSWLGLETWNIYIWMQGQMRLI